MNIHLTEISASLQLEKKDGLWFATLNIFYFGNFKGSITRGGYALKSSAIGQATRLFNNRMFHASWFL